MHVQSKEDVAEKAQALYEQSLDIARAIGYRWCIATNLVNLTQIYHRRVNLAESWSCMAQAMPMARSIGSTSLELDILAEFAWHCLLTGDAERGAELIGLVASHPATEALVREEAERLMYDDFRKSLTPQGFADALERGKMLDLDTVVHFVTHELTTSGRP